MFYVLKQLDYDYPSYVTESAQKFINKFLLKNPKKRIDLSDALRDPWIAKNTTKRLN